MGKKIKKKEALIFNAISSRLNKRRREIQANLLAPSPLTASLQMKNVKRK